MIVPLLATPATAQERSHENGIRTQTYVTEGREIGSSALECRLHAAPQICDLSIKSEFNLQKSNLMVPAFFDLTSCCRRHPISSVSERGFKLCRRVFGRVTQPLPTGPVNKEPNNEAEILFSRAAAHAVARDVGYGSDANGPAPGIRKRARGCGSALERRLHDRPRAKPMR